MGKPKGCILVIDDSNFSRMFIKKALETEGYMVIDVESGEEVVNDVYSSEKNKTGLFEKNKVDLIIMDVAMPKIDGIQTAMFLKKSQYGNIPIIFNSAVDDKGTVIKAIKAGGVDYVIKSGKIDVLVSKINKIVEKGYHAPFKIMEEKVEFDFYTYLKLEVSHAKRGKHPLTLLVLSLFTKKGETEEPLPDEMVREGVETVKKKMRDIDGVLRFGPSKILLVLPTTGKEGSRVVEKKVVDIIGSHKFLSTDIGAATISMKFGRATLPDDSDTWETLLEKAQEGL
ncbi:MAG: response regulator [Nitrospinae bacterium]|nr:response regulator [Nitrospinota bacterium]